MDWYELSYRAFLNQPVETKEDVIRLIACAYSWMPTIPDVKPDVDWNRLIDLIGELKTGNTANRRELLSILVPMVNNSIVGSSKVLHFIAPELVPIIDSRVVKAWNKRFKAGESGYNFKLPGSFFFTNEAGMNRVIDIFLKYWDAMQNHAKVSGKTIRELEFELFNEGKSKT